MLAPILLFIAGFVIGGASSRIADPTLQSICLIVACLSILAAIVLSFGGRGRG